MPIGWTSGPMSEIVYTRRDYTDACQQEGALLGWHQRYAS
jgi:hypothetical protein